MELRDELLAEVGPKTHIAELCGRASDELLIKQMKIDQQQRALVRMHEQVRIEKEKNRWAHKAYSRLAAARQTNSLNHSWRDLEVEGRNLFNTHNQERDG
jgi:hypothetical protein